MKHNTRRSLWLSVACLLFFATTVHATPVTINDNYIGAEPTHVNYVGNDVVGTNNLFDISSMSVNLYNSTLTVDIVSSYFDNVGQYGTQLGDLFISDDGWNPYGSDPYLNDQASNGEDWEYALVIDDHTGSTQSGDVTLHEVSDSDIELSHASGIYRAGQEVQYNTANYPSLASGSWQILLGQGDYDILRFIINLSGTSLAYGGDWGFHWGMTCANDVIEGGAQVPEPATALLLVTGLIGCAIRKLQKQTN